MVGFLSLEGAAMPKSIHWMGCKLDKWPSLGKNGRAYVRSSLEPEDKEAHAKPQCFVCGYSLEKHNWEKNSKQEWVQLYCRIPEYSTKPFCDESHLRSRWARMMNRFYKRMAADMEAFDRQIERWENR